MIDQTVANEKSANKEQYNSYPLFKERILSIGLECLLPIISLSY